MLYVGLPVFIRIETSHVPVIWTSEWCKGM